MSERYNIKDTIETEIGRFRIVQHLVDVNGKEYPYSFVDVKDSVAVLAKEQDRFIFLKQYRKTINDITLEIPGGAIDENETPEHAALRELQEETGFTAAKILLLGDFYPTIGISNERCHLYYVECRDCEKIKLEPLEQISVIKMSEQEVEDNIASGELMHSMALVAWLKYKMSERK